MVPHVCTVHFDVERPSAEPAWQNMGIVLESGENRAKEKPYRVPSTVCVRFQVAVSVRQSECVRVVRALMSVLTAGWNKKVLRAIGYSVRSVSKDELIHGLRQTIKTLTC